MLRAQHHILSSTPPHHLFQGLQSLLLLEGKAGWGPRVGGNEGGRQGGERERQSARWREKGWLFAVGACRGHPFQSRTHPHRLRYIRKHGRGQVWRATRGGARGVGRAGVFCTTPPGIFIFSPSSHTRQALHGADVAGRGRADGQGGQGVAAAAVGRGERHGGLWDWGCCVELCEGGLGRKVE